MIHHDINCDEEPQVIFGEDNIKDDYYSIGLGKRKGCTSECPCPFYTTTRHLSTYYPNIISVITSSFDLVHDGDFKIGSVVYHPECMSVSVTYGGDSHQCPPQYNCMHTHKLRVFNIKEEQMYVACLGDKGGNVAKFDHSAYRLRNNESEVTMVDGSKIRYDMSLLGHLLFVAVSEDRYDIYPYICRYVWLGRDMSFQEEFYNDRISVEEGRFCMDVMPRDLALNVCHPIMESVTLRQFLLRYPIPTHFYPKLCQLGHSMAIFHNYSDISILKDYIFSQETWVKFSYPNFAIPKSLSCSWQFQGLNFLKPFDILIHDLRIRNDGTQLYIESYIHHNGIILRTSDVRAAKRIDISVNCRGLGYRAQCSSIIDGKEYGLFPMHSVRTDIYLFSSEPIAFYYTDNYQNFHYPYLNDEVYLPFSYFPSNEIVYKDKVSKHELSCFTAFRLPDATTTASGISGWIAELEGVFVRMVDNIIEGVLKIVEPVIINIIDALIPELERIIITLGPAIERLIDVLLPLAEQFAELIFRVLTSVITRLIPTVLQFFRSAFDMLISAFGTVGERVFWSVVIYFIYSFYYHSLSRGICLLIFMLYVSSF